MLESVKWETVYELWQREHDSFSQTLTEPVPVETIWVDYDREGYIYGYDWLEATQVPERKQLIEKNPIEFLYFTKPSNKGTIQTAEMLAEARDEEEQAALWIAATAKELSEYHIGKNLGCYSHMLYEVACEFLRTRYYLWHHAMKKLVPDIMVPFSVLESMTCKNLDAVIGLIQTNIVLLKNNWRIIRYTSLKDGETPESACRK